jgi:hypothetical protein
MLTMPIYRIFINKQETGEFVTATSIEDAYADVATAVPLKYSDHVQIIEVNSPQAKPGLPVGNNTIQASTKSTLEQELEI